MSDEELVGQLTALVIATDEAMAECKDECQQRVMGHHNLFGFSNGVDDSLEWVSRCNCNNKQAIATALAAFQKVRDDNPAEWLLAILMG